jgi:hypothetical protein
MHNIPLTEMEYKGLIGHGLDTDSPSQLSDAFRQGVRYALDSMKKQSVDDGNFHCAYCGKTNSKTAMDSSHESDCIFYGIDRFGINGY